VNILARLRQRKKRREEELARAYASGYRRGRRVRVFASAQVDRLTADWTTTPLSADEVLRRTLRTLRARSRERWQNDDYARRFIGMVRSNVVGPKGISFQARIRDPNGQQDNLANDAVEAAWKRWGRAEHCDVTGRLNWTQMQMLFITSVALDGEALVRLLVAPSRKPYRFVLQFLDPELLDVDYNEELRGGRYIRMGIEFDPFGRPVAYHVLDAKTSDEGYLRYGRRYRRISAEEMIHAFIPELVGQSRGIPWMATALLRMKMLGAYEDAAVVAARIGAAKMGFYASDEGGEYTGTDEDPTGELIEDVEPGTFQSLPRGVKLETWDPEYPKGEFGDFVKACLRGIASGLGVAYNTLSNDLEGVNFSSIRAGVLEDREVWKALQEWMIEAFCRPVYERWLTIQLAMGTITVPGKDGAPKPLNPAREEKYRQVSWQPRRWAWVDPLKDMKANELAIKLGLASRSQLIREQGLEPEEVWKEIQRENELLAALGLEFKVEEKTGAIP
jgi:lambda family phage portal protein